MWWCCWCWCSRVREIRNARFARLLIFGVLVVVVVGEMIEFGWREWCEEEGITVRACFACLGAAFRNTDCNFGEMGSSGGGCGLAQNGND